MKEEKTKLSMIIVSWNGKDLVRACLESIERYPANVPFEVIVVDNGSTDGTREMLHKLQVNNYKLKVIPSDKNVGFAKGNNMGLKQAKGDLILLLNNDTEVTKGAMDAIVEFMDKHSKCGFLGPKLLNPDGSLQLSVRNFPTLCSQLMVLTKLHNFFPRFGPVKNYFQTDFDYDKELQVNQVMGAALMTRRKVIDQVGMLDPGYKKIFEEVDFCSRVKKAGWEAWYSPKAEIIHHKGQSFTRVKTFSRQLAFNQGMRRYFWKHKPMWQYLIILLFQSVSWAASLLDVFLTRLAGNSIKKRYKKRQF